MPPGIAVEGLLPAWGHRESAISPGGPKVARFGAVLGMFTILLAMMLSLS